jgi:hypothetical protein
VDGKQYHRHLADSLKHLRRLCVKGKLSNFKRGNYKLKEKYNVG